MDNDVHQKQSNLLTMREVAAELGVCYLTVSRWVNSKDSGNRLPSIRRGRKYIRISRDQLETFKANLGGAK